MAYGSYALRMFSEFTHGMKKMKNNEQSLTLYTTTLARWHITNQDIQTGKHKVSETPDRLRCPVGVEKLDSFS